VVVQEGRGLVRLRRLDQADIDEVVSGVDGALDAAVERRDGTGDVRTAGRSTALFANRAESSCWRSSRTFTAKTPERSMSWLVSEALEVQISTSGGSRLTDANADTVMPCTCAPSRDVTIVTPVAQEPRTLLN
jgi:hypothetical protein